MKATATVRRASVGRDLRTLRLTKLIKTATGDVLDVGVHTQFAVEDDTKVTNFIQRRDELVFYQQ